MNIPSKTQLFYSTARYPAYGTSLELRWEGCCSHFRAARLGGGLLAPIEKRAKSEGSGWVFEGTLIVLLSRDMQTLSCVFPLL